MENDLLKQQNQKKIVIDFKKSPFEKYQNKFSTSLSTLLLGMILFVIGFVILGYSEGVLRESNTVQGLPLLEVDSLTRTEGLVKITGYPITSCEIKVPACTENLVYFKKIREEEVDGKFVQVREDQTWANIRLGEINISPSEAKLIFKLHDISKQEGEDLRNGKTVKYRETITGVADSEKLIVVGQLKNKEIKSGGSMFLISNKTNGEIVDYLKEGKTMNWWIFKISSFLLLTLGIAAFVLPILVFLDIFTELGFILTSLIFVMSAFVAFIFVFLSTIVLTYWWLIFVIVGIVIFMLIKIKSRSKKKQVNLFP